MTIFKQRIDDPLGNRLILRDKGAIIMKKLTFLIVATAFVGISAAGGAGAFTDNRDGKTYKTVVIGGKTWMAENINIKAGNSWCYDNKESNCNKYGRLYTWNAAKTACPSGWHLPTVQEWDNLSQAAGGVRKSEKIDGLWDVFHWDGAGKHLKASSGWSDYQGASGNGTDDFGFSALPGGYRYTDGDFDDAGYSGDWWTATEYDASDAYRRIMNYSNDYVTEDNNNKEYGFSVRCVGD
jgi:uncharacterized protein (TIGR02145 family)